MMDHIKEKMNLSDYDNVLIADEQGSVIFYDLADLNVLKELGQRPEEFMGKHITTSFKDLSEKNSTILQVLKTGEAICNAEQELITKTGNTFVTRNSTYPIIENGKVIGAVEFSKHFFAKENIQSLDKYAGNKVYRKNNTIYTIDNIITGNPWMERVKEQIRKVARTNSTVLIYGKTGTGKEIAAQAIHNLSERYEKPFTSLNCGAIPASLLESTLFGTTKGSFTGSEDMPGLFEQAEGGTLFLDEINSLDFDLQVKLLKAIEEKTIRRLGGKKNIALNIRVISATNEDPDILLRENRLREDLFYRLGVVQFDLLPLPQRKEDIELLTEYYINFYNEHMNILIERADEEVMALFQRYDWPGNIRELKNAIETAYNHAESNVITMEDIPERIRRYSEKMPGTLAQKAVQPLKEAVEQFEKEMIMAELERSGGVIAKTARKLGLSKQSLKYKMDKYMLR
ncbi:arginine utilization transcriptional regulator RocR [Aeromicrobium ponti]|uniref:Arginine utilization regulatory protein n=1 Tax=Cytobacillus oceanisediminis TaxID=665099 RepID=A0A562JM00_9BACI|nr:sigma 54-interacting transcriptional regulator [Cytobacillus oceanisediminis]TWH84053.1 arginine utilization regulatory protein [Cytobacillus oceanisediminis]